MRTTATLSIPLILVIALTSTAIAKPPGPSAFCDTYPASALCQGDSVPDCTLCHSAAPNLNPYGAAIAAELLPGEPRPLSDSLYTSGLPAALAAVEDDDTDGDGFSNFDEIIEGTQPGDAQSKPEDLECPPNDYYNLCEYDHSFAYRRVSLDVCGQSPTFEEMETLRGLTSDAERQASLESKLTTCLDSAFWAGKDGVLSSLANRKIRPVGTLKAGEGPGTVAIADYDHDYDLFVWSQIDNHDAREAMTAQYFVDRDQVGALRVLTEQEVTDTFTGAARENVPVAQRAGILTTAWTLLYFEMFAIIPRAAAAQASRAFLREDWARMEGLSPVSGVVDYDNAGVMAPACAVCHSTIEPAAWAYQDYAGFVGGAGGRAVFVPNRMDLFEGAFPGISDMPNGYFKGEQVPDLVTWAQRAADSDPFAKATVMDYWEIFIGRDEPTGTLEIDEYTALWQDFRSVDSYGVEAMLFKLIRTRSYGEP